jgi:CRP/FNR family transcriptional regulator, cyclic AMP receptor protein
MQKQMFKKGEIICEEGSTGREMYVILSGSADVFKTVNAEKVKLSTLKRNDFLGELCILLNMPRTATVEAAEDTEVLVIKQKEFIHKVQENPKFAVRMLTVMARRLVEAHQIISKLEGTKRSLEIMYKDKFSE